MRERAACRSRLSVEAAELHVRADRILARAGDSPPLRGWYAVACSHTVVNIIIVRVSPLLEALQLDMAHSHER